MYIVKIADGIYMMRDRKTESCKTGKARVIEKATHTRNRNYTQEQAYIFDPRIINTVSCWET